MTLVPRFFSASGREELKQVHSAAAALEHERSTKGLLKGGKEKELQRLRTMTRRDFCEKLMVGLGLTAGLAAGGMALMPQAGKKEEQDKPDGNSPKKTNESALSEEQMDQLIAGVEEGFLEWGKNIRVLVKENGGLPKGATAEHFYGPFETMELNVENPIKNPVTLKRLHANDHEVKMEDVNFFSYGTLDQMDRRIDRSAFIALFDPARRSLHLDTNIDSHNPTDMLVIYHEIIHAVQDANIRGGIRSKEEFDKYAASLAVKPGGRMRLNIITEIDAYGSELELANILMKGTLRNGTATMDDMMRTLRPRPDHVQTVKMLHELASVYFPHGISNGTYSPLFVELISTMYKDRGYDVYLQQ